MKMPNQPKTNPPGWEKLPERLRRRLSALATEYRREGVDLFLFGSFARGDNRANSDLDLGVEWRGTPSRKIFRRLSSDIENLPSIRKIDLVDMSEAGESLRRAAHRERKPLV